MPGKLSMGRCYTLLASEPSFFIPLVASTDEAWHHAICQQRNGPMSQACDEGGFGIVNELTTDITNDPAII